MSGSSVSWFSKFAFFFAAASGRYGISPPSTTPRPPGSAPTATSATTSPVRAACSWRSQFAVLTACQTPFKSASPSAVRGALYDPAARAADVAPRRSAVARTAAAFADSAPVTHFFCITRSSPKPPVLLLLRQILVEEYRQLAE